MSLSILTKEVMKQPFTFDVQLNIGKAGEAFILGAHPELRFPKEGERRWDLEGGYPDGSRRTVEVKVDMYPMLSTENFFMERTTNLRKQRRNIEGGPWRTAEDGVREFVYLFANGGSKEAPSSPIAYWFRDVPALVARLERLKEVGHEGKRLQMRRVRSLDVSALGYLVPRSAVADICDCVVYREESQRPTTSQSESANGDTP